MKRGQYGSPYRSPVGGWFVPPRTYFGGLYQHQRPALNDLPRMVNNTQITLQPNQVGRPMTRPANTSAANPSSCEDQLDNGLPHMPWIGPATGGWQGLPPSLGGSLTNTFAQNGTNSFGLATRQRGGKWVQAIRQWHGTHGLTSHDNGLCQDKICLTEVADPNGNHPGDPGYVPTYQSYAYEGPIGGPDQTKYCTYSPTASFSWYLDNTDARESKTASLTGSIHVDPQSGKITHNLWSTEDDYHNDYSTGINTQMLHAAGGAGFSREAYSDPVTPHPSGMSTIIDTVAGSSAQCPPDASIPLINSTMAGVDSFISGYLPYATSVSGLPATFNRFITDYAPYAVSFNRFPPVSDPYNYGSASAPVTGQIVFSDGSFSHTIQVKVWWTCDATTYNCGVIYDDSYTNPGPDSPTMHWEFRCTQALSNPVTSASIYADVKQLLGYWPLNDDALYPPRTDGIWQVAPLMSRDERPGNTTPLQGFLPATLDDLRHPVVDINGNSPWSSALNPPRKGWHYSPNNRDGNGRAPGDPDYQGPADWQPTYQQIPWFDTYAYGWQFPPGMDAGSSAAIALVQYGCTGLILGMPLPRAFTDPASYWYQAGYSYPAGATFENFFDYKALVYKACLYTDPETGQKTEDFYLWGYGEWLYDAITRTGAQLPHCATQWTNNNDAMSKCPYAYLIQADSQTYDFGGLQPGANSDFHAGRGDGLWAQKCVEIAELWPSQNYFGPAAANRTTPANLAAGRYAPDETAVYCIANWGGDTCYLQSDPANINSGDLIGVNSNGNSGVYSCNVDHAAQSITLGTFHYPFPTGFALPSGDDGDCIWKIRFPDAPAILGRDAIATLTAAGAGTLITLVNPEPFLQTGDSVDICATRVTYDGAGNKTGESMGVLATATVTRIDDSNFQVPLTLGGLTGAGFITSHGAPAWYWDDTFRKGDFAVYQWLYDYRTNGWLANSEQDCAEHAANTLAPPAGSPAPNNGYQNPVGITAACTPGNAVDWDGAAFSANGRIIYKPCCYGAIAITPNGETWPNGIVIPFPDNFLFDTRYGARWQAEIEQAMAEIYWQAPHSPCGQDPSIQWTMDDGSCRPDTDLAVYYAMNPMVEARTNLPSGAPALPAGVTLGHGNPVTYPALSNALYPPGQIGYDTASGNPNGAWTIWGYRLALDGTCGGCRFDYVDLENLACMNVNYTAPQTSTPDGNTSAGSTGDGLT